MQPKASLQCRWMPLLFAVAVGAPFISQSADRYWNANSGNPDYSGTWDTVTANWNTGPGGTGAQTTFANGDNAIFDANATYAVTAGAVTVGTISVQAGTITFSGGTATATGMTIASGATVTNNSSTFFKSGTTSIRVDGALRLTVDTGSGRTLSLTGSGTITGTSIRLSGSGNPTFSGTIPTGILWNGGSGGTITLTGNDGTTKSDVLMSVNGSILKLGAASALSANRFLRFEGSANSTRLELAAGDFKRVYTATGDGRINWSGTAAGFYATGGDRTFSFVTTLGGTTLADVVWGNNGLSSSTVVFGHANATHKMIWNNNLDLNGATRTFQVEDGAADVDLELSGNISGGAVALAKTGSGTLQLSGDNSAWTGDLTMPNAGSTAASWVRVVSNTGLGAAATAKTIALGSSTGAATGGIELASNVTVDNKLITIGGRSDDATDRSFLRNVSGNNTWNGKLQIINGGGTYFIGSLSGVLTLGADLSNEVAGGARAFNLIGAGDFNMSGRVVDGAGTTALTMRGTGTAILSGTNTFGGNLTISSGTVKLGGAGTIPDGAGKGNVVLDGGNTVAATLDLNGVDETINGLSGASGTVLGRVVNNAAGTAKTLTLGAGDVTASFAGLIANNSGAGGTLGVTKTGTGTQTLSGANTYTAPTTLGAGTLSISVMGNGGGSSGIGSASSAAANLVFDGGTLDYSGPTASSDRNFTVNSGKVAAFSVSSSGSILTLLGTAPATTGALRKVGAGTLVLNSGASTTFKGLVTSAGTLEHKSGTTTLSSGAGTTAGNYGAGFVNAGGGTFRLSGGTVTAAAGNYIFTAGRTTDGAGTFIQDGGTFDGGNNEVLNAYGASGTTTLNGGLFIAGQFRIAQASGALTLNGGTLKVNNVTSASASQKVYWNGGTLEAKLNQAKFIGDLAGTDPLVLIRSGGAVINSGTFNITIPVPLQEDSTSPGGGLLKFGSGMLTLSGTNSYTGSTTVSNGTLMVNGSLAGGGVVTVLSNAVLSGSGLLLGAVSVQQGGTLSPGNAIGILTVSNAVVLNGKLSMELNRGLSPNADLLTADSLACGGALIVTNTGAALQGGDTFILFNTTNQTGFFASTNLPALAAGQNWWTPDNFATLTVNQLAANSAAYTRAPGLSLKILVSDLLTNVLSMPAGDSFTLAGVGPSANGATVTTDGARIYYTPGTGAASNSNDSFTYTVNSARGGTVTGTINVNVVGAIGPVAQNVAVNNGTASITFFGIPGYTYVVQTTTNSLPTTNWWNVSTNMAGTNGQWLFTDPNATNTQQFYRPAQP